MKYYRIIPNSNNYFKAKTIADSAGGSEDLLNYGTLCDTWVEPCIRIIEDGVYGDFLSWVGSIICSAKAYDKLKNIVQNVEFLPVKTELGLNYYALNVTGKVALDEKTSECARTRKGMVITIEKYAFQKADLKDILIFNPKQAVHEGPIVSEEFKVIVEENNLEGLIFKKVFEY